jgi:hypothetical protein
MEQRKNSLNKLNKYLLTDEEKKQMLHDYKDGTLDTKFQQKLTERNISTSMV